MCSEHSSLYLNLCIIKFAMELIVNGKVDHKIQSPNSCDQAEVFWEQVKVMLKQQTSEMVSMHQFTVKHNQYYNLPITNLSTKWAVLT